MQFHKQQFDYYQLSQSKKYDDIQSTIIDSLKALDHKVDRNDLRINKIENQVNNSIDTRLKKLEKQIASLTEAPRLTTANSGLLNRISPANSTNGSNIWAHGVVVIGLPSSAHEDLSASIQALCKAINYTESTAIVIADWLGAVQIINGPLRLRFSSPGACKEFLEARRKKGQITTSDLGSNPETTGHRNVLIYRCSPRHLIQLREDILNRYPGIKSKDVWAGESKVYVKINDTDQIITLKDRHDLYRLPVPPNDIENRGQRHLAAVTAKK